MVRLYTAILLVALTLASAAIHADDLKAAMTRLFQTQLALANTDSPDAQYFVGEMYENGFGTPRSLDKAFAWYAKAAQNGNAAAATKIKRERSIRLKYAEQQKLTAERARREAQANSNDQWEELASAQIPPQPRQWKNAGPLLTDTLRTLRH